MTAPYPPKAADERTMLLAFLDYYRAVLIDKAAGLTDEQLRTRLGPSTLTLGGLVHHMAVVEDWWFTQVIANEPAPEPWASAPWDDDRDWEFTIANEMSYDAIVAQYEESMARSRTVMDTVESLDQTTVRERDGEPFTVRWILVHLIEEIARHAGHADLIRESIDGETGDFRGD